VLQRKRGSTTETSECCWPLSLTEGLLTSKTGTFHPKHIIQATGFNCEPRIPNFPGMDKFKGTILHSTQFDNGAPEYAGKKVVVVGTETSGHDIANCLYRFGADVIIVQRSPTYVMSLGAIYKIVRLRYNEATACSPLPALLPHSIINTFQPTDDSDLLSMSAPTTLFKRIGSDAAAHFQDDKPLIEALSAAGFLTWQGEPPALLPLTIHRAGGFYLDIGTSFLIASGKIRIKSGQAITSLSANSVVFADGKEVEADEVISARDMRTAG
jgi:hypothetical protein